MEDFNLFQELSNGRRIVIPREVAYDAVQKNHETIPTAQQIPEQEPGARLESQNDRQEQKKVPFQPGKIEPQFHFNIQIHLPENSSSEVYEAIFRSISIHLLGRSEDDK